MSAPGVKKPSILPHRISRALLDHLHQDHPAEAAVADRLIAEGEWVIGDD